MDQWVLGVVLLVVLAAFALWQWWGRAGLIVAGVDFEDWPGTYREYGGPYQITLSAGRDHTFFVRDYPFTPTDVPGVYINKTLEKDKGGVRLEFVRPSGGRRQSIITTIGTEKRRLWRID